MSDTLSRSKNHFSNNERIISRMLLNNAHTNSKKSIIPTHIELFLSVKAFDQVNPNNILTELSDSNTTSSKTKTALKCQKSQIFAKHLTNSIV